MARIKLSLPQQFQFQTHLPIRITDINYGHHLANDALLGLMHEARLQYLHHYGYSEGDLGGAGLVITDVAINYKSQGFWGDIIRVNLAATDGHRYGFDFVYYMFNERSGKELARAKTGIASFDYEQQKLVSLPQQVKHDFQLV